MISAALVSLTYSDSQNIHTIDEYHYFLHFQKNSFTPGRTRESRDQPPITVLKNTGFNVKKQVEGLKNFQNRS